MTNGGREAQVLEAVVSLVDSLLDDFDVVELLTQLTEQCARLLDVASAGLLLASPGGRLQLMAATSERTRDVEVFQLQSEQGPCLDCYASGREVSVADLRTEGDRWPQFVEVALDAGFASVHAVPMRAAGMVLGSLGLFGTKAGELNASDLTVGQTLAHVATVAVLQEGAPTQHAVLPRLRAALASRVVVEQAKGFLRGRLDVSVDEAFVLLRRYALAHGEHLTQAARRLVSDPSSRPEILALITEMSR
jgi:GAF domain-containing protein